MNVPDAWQSIYAAEAISWQELRWVVCHYFLAVDHDVALCDLFNVAMKTHFLFAKDSVRYLMCNNDQRWQKGSPSAECTTEGRCKQ